MHQRVHNASMPMDRRPAERRPSEAIYFIRIRSGFEQDLTNVIRSCGRRDVQSSQPVIIDRRDRVVRKKLASG